MSKKKGSVVLLSCRGINPRTGKRVGSRHSWPNGWGVGQCRFCHRGKDELEVYSPHVEHVNSIR